MEYCETGEAPRYMYFWVGVSTIAGALRRRVWLDQKMFRWHCNMYIILVAPPGIVSKSTTAELGMELLRQVPGVKFGPSVVTWQSLVQTFGQAAEMFELPGGVYETMSPLTVASSEFGNLLDPTDRAMMDTLVNLWDGKSFQKATKNSGNDDVINPWINIIACTTPDWIAGSFPEYAIGGGFTSRCIFVYAGEKERFVAYPSAKISNAFDARKADLVYDLEHISTALKGEYKLTPDAIRWGEAWYEKHFTVDVGKMDSSRFGGYMARKQTHIHKLAMVLAASMHDNMEITADDLTTAEEMVTALEPEMQHVFAKIGQSKESIQVDRFMSWIEKQGTVTMEAAVRYMQAHFPFKKDFNEMVAMQVASGQLHLKTEGSRVYLRVGLEPSVEHAQRLKAVN